ncbi:hypothetical protein [Streptomyces sp. NPDC051211]|uniref:SMP-30/gluconolactonase/LRE family protein n=1 Tax=Streptomyces sp. NPDC051211 TaxID=3154643 RepID=UPI0034502235
MPRTPRNPRLRALRRRVPRAAGTAALAVALTVLAVAPTSAGEQPLALSHPRVVTRFDFAAGQTPENIVLEPDGSANLTFAHARQVARVTVQGDTRILATLPSAANATATPLIGVAVVTGIARTRDGSLYVGYPTGTADLTGIWRIAPDGSVSRFAALPPDGFANGLAVDERRGVLYAADSVRGTVWRVSLRDGSVTAWATRAELQPVSSVGANGIQLRPDAVWVSNPDHGTLLRIPVLRDGSAGVVQTRATGLAGIDDFAFVGTGETVLAALHTTSEIAVVQPDGTHSVLLGPRDGLTNPTSVAVRQQQVYVPGAASATMQDPNLLLARLGKQKKHRA